jgi:hypothetical protein
MSTTGRTVFWRRILNAMATATVAFVLVTPITGAHAATVKPSKMHALYQSRDLWATLNVCGPKDQPNTIGIRGSMPSDGHEKDVMYMRFIVQSLDATTKQWTDLGKNADSGFVAVGSAKSIRQAGRSFELVPASGGPPAMLRGVVDFQWRRGNAIVGSVSRVTSTEHKSLAGADPEGYSAATCSLS